jgi:perosamine synthetase
MIYASPASDFVSRLQRVLGHSALPIALHEPEFSGNEWLYVKECLDTGWVSSVGKFVDEFEARLAEVTGAKHAIAVVNGTAGLHVALHVAEVMPGDEVFAPALTFVATANAIAHCGAVPHFIDSEERTFGMDPEALSNRLAEVAEPIAGGGYRNRLTGRRLAGIVPMHVFGQPMEIEALVEIAGRYGLPIVEDAAESLGSFSSGKHTGTFGSMGVLSFNGNKVITTGGGGAVLTNDSTMAHRLKSLTTTAKRPHPWEFVHDETAFNYRLPNLNAALGCAQLEQLPGMLLRKRRLADAYANAFADCSPLIFTRRADSNCWLNAIRFVGANFEDRDFLLRASIDAGYHCRPVWRLMHRLPMYQACPRGPVNVAERLECELINLPSSAVLAERLS